MSAVFRMISIIQLLQFTATSLSTEFFWPCDKIWGHIVQRRGGQMVRILAGMLSVLHAADLRFH